MIGENHDGIESERMSLSGSSHCFAHDVNMLGKRTRAAICKRRGDEECSASDEISSVLHHS
jgi:hypothetical protein